MGEELTYTAFGGDRVIASGPLERILPKAKDWQERAGNPLLLIFEDQSGRQVDFDLRGTLPIQPQRTGPGRPRLGVVSREVSLLPRHWEWLEEQQCGASAAIRRLVDDARKREPEKQLARLSAEATGRFLTAVAGNFAGYEEATRALYAGSRKRFEELIRDWPADIRAHALGLAKNALAAE